MDRIASAAKRAGRDPSSIRLVVVTKTIDRDRIREAVAAGAAILGENRVQEAKEKIEALGKIASWHLIGHLQTNKAKYAVKLFDLIHSVDNLELAQEIDRQAAKIGKVQDILIEVNIAGEASKAGMAVKGAPALVREAARLKNISIQGLMTMPPYSENPGDSRPYFRHAPGTGGDHREGKHPQRLDAGAVHGHERRFRGGHRGRGDAGAGGDGDIRKEDLEQFATECTEYSEDSKFNGGVVFLTVPPSVTSVAEVRRIHGS